ncbi:DUF6949 family protein [Pseudohoeflea coraliihabitans]|uniref:Uncharacterized protein n=1 Tax=Pseudohoeflea coraliihabitans TaxID=2860393 RepID=A0ABS6WQG1_9HYPH|nr:hypothetical protein [Pseudohoeflea sp. DP4N28-3]MBW3098207.1 hypothetical protein [Pseudohoeflea sp. DP4N28-3]
MVNLTGIQLAIGVLAVGATVSWIASRLVRIGGWQPPAHTGEGFELFRFADLLIASLAGPELLCGVTVAGVRRGELHAGWCLTLFLIAGGWAMLIGIIALELLSYGLYPGR